MSFQVQINIPELVKAIERVLCDDCKGKLYDVEMPVRQAVKVRDLVRKPGR